MLQANVQAEIVRSALDYQQPSLLRPIDMPDPTTQSNYLSIITKHVSFDWTVDFDKKMIRGSATHTLLVQDSVVKEVVYVGCVLRSNKTPSIHQSLTPGCACQLRHWGSCHLFRRSRWRKGVCKCQERIRPILV